jgi:hypothetical protein
MGRGAAGGGGGQLNDVDIAVLMFADHHARRRCGRWNRPLWEYHPLAGARRARGRLPRPLIGLPAVYIDDPGDPEVLDAAIAEVRRVVVVGADADLAAVLTRLLRAGRLNVEVGYAPRRRTAATRIYRVRAGRRAARRARRGSARRVPLIRDESGSAIVGAAHWRPPGDTRLLHGEVVVDDAVLFDGDAEEVRIEPTAALPGLRARVSGSRHGSSGRWVPGRAAQLGTTSAAVVRDGVPAPRAARRSTFYRNTEGWLLVR